MELLNEIQKKIKVKKGHFNSFAKFYYRTCDDILEAIKPMLGDGTIIITDEPVFIEGRFYIKSVVTLKCGEESESCTAYAREPESKKGMDEPQVTGMASSYARKFALSGLLGLDDSKDPDSEEKDDEKEIELNEKQLEFSEKLKIKLEECMDGEPIDLEKLRRFLILQSKNTGRPIPETTEDEKEDANKLNRLAVWLIGSAHLEQVKG